MSPKELDTIILRSDFIGRLRKKFIDQNLLQDSRPNKKRLTPQYDSIPEYFLALNLANELQFFVSQGLSIQELVELFNTSTGLRDLQALLQRDKNRAPTLERTAELVEPEVLRYITETITSSDVLHFIMECLTDSALLKWVEESIPNLETAEEAAVDRHHRLIGWIAENQEALHLLTGRSYFNRLFSTVNPHREAIFSTISLGTILSKIEALHFVALNSLQQVTGLILDLDFKEATELFLFAVQAKKEHQSNWGTKFLALDILSNSGAGMLPFYQVEYLYARAALQQQQQAAGIPESLAYPLLGTRGLAKQYRTSEDSFALLQTKTHKDQAVTTLDAERYSHWNRYESELHPLFHLLLYIGVEAETATTSEIKAGLYQLISEHIIYKGTGGHDLDFEYSAAPVKRVETLLFLYQKLIESNFLDLFVRRSYGVHWNAETKSISLTAESLSVLLLTGTVSLGRNKKSRSIGIRDNLYSNSSKLGGYIEWKQGDLISPEVFSYGSQLWDTVMIAQAAYEDICQALLSRELGTEIPNYTVEKTADRLSEHHYIQNNGQFDRFCSKNMLTDEQIQDPELTNITEEQRKLATLYRDFRKIIRSFFTTAIDPFQDIYNPADIWLGAELGMELSTQWLMTVFPTFDSFFETEPEAEYEAMKPSDPRYNAFKAVNFALKTTKRIMYQVREILYEAEHAYLPLMKECATAFINKDEETFFYLSDQILTRYRIPLVDRTKKKDEGGTLTHQELVILEMFKRFDWILKNYDLSEEEQAIFAQFEEKK